MFVPIGGGGEATYHVSRSVRFRKSASAYISRTPGSAGNRKLLSRRYRVKRGELGTLQVLGSAGTSSVDRLYFDTSDRLCLDVLGTQRLVSTRAFRDPTAWLIDVQLQLDVANATAASRAKILVEGVELAYTTDTRSSIANSDTNWNNTVVQYLGRDTSSNYFDGYMAEAIGVDGAITSGYIGTDPISGQASTAMPSATYGTTGFYLPFSDTTSLTTLMADSSGNGNNWTASNISLTAGATYDSMTDVPLAYGTTDRGNYAVLNPLQSGSYVTLTNGNLTVTGNTATDSAIAVSTIDANGLQVYYEAQSNWSFGAITSAIPQTALIDSEANSNNYGFAVRYDGSTYGVTGEVQTVAAFSFTSSDVIGVAIDAINGAIYISKNGTWLNSGIPTSGASKTGAFYKWTPSSARSIFPHMSGYNGTVGNANFGQRPFTYTPPTGYKALHTGNLTSTTAITSGSYTGNLSAGGPVIWCNGTPETLTINGNAVTWGTHADKLANGFKVRSTSSSYNSSGTNTWTATYLSPSSKSAFKYQNAKGNP